MFSKNRLVTAVAIATGTAIAVTQVSAEMDVVLGS